MTTTVSLIQTSAAVGAALPVVASILTQDRLSARANSLIAAGVAVVAAIVTCLATGVLTLDAAGINRLGASLLAVYALSTATYAGLWRPTGVAPAVRTATSYPSGGARTTIAGVLRAAAGALTPTPPDGTPGPAPAAVVAPVAETPATAVPVSEPAPAEPTEPTPVEPVTESSPTVPATTWPVTLTP